MILFISDKMQKWFTWVISFIVVVFCIFSFVFQVIVIPYYHIGVIDRFGNIVGFKESGIHICFRFDKVHKFFLGDSVIEFSSQNAITNDKANVKIHGFITYTIMKPQGVYSSTELEKLLHLNINMQRMLIISISSHIRNLCSNITLFSLMTERGNLRIPLIESLNKILCEYGILVKNIEIREIEPTNELRILLNEQLSTKIERDNLLIRTNAKIESDNLLAQNFKNMDRNVLPVILFKDYLKTLQRNSKNIYITSLYNCDDIKKLINAG